MLYYREFTPIPHIPICSKNKNKYYVLPATFDIETSSFYNSNGDKRAVMYIWQMCVFGVCYYGRTYEDMLNFFNMLKQSYNKGRIIVYVHNLAFDSHFILKWLNVTKMFATDPYKPLYFEVDNFLVFKCSYRLSGKSLEKLSENFKDDTLHKQKGFDYALLRTPITKLSDLELKYCEYDVKVLYQFILDETERNSKITKIPLTNTSYVRIDSRTECNKDPNYRYGFFEKCTPTKKEIFLGLRAAFMGGLTHCNQLYTGLTLDNITNYDLQSDYPSQILKNKYPCTPYVESDIKHFPKNNNVAVLAVVKFIGLNAKYFHSLLSVSKCMVYCETKHKNIFGCFKCPLKDTCTDCLVLDNGRIIKSGNITTTITEIDFLNICDMYDFTSYEILKAWTSEKEYLPKCFVYPVLKWYGKKTTLKGDKSKKLEYNIAKQMLNANYGMCVTNPLHPEIKYTPENEKMWTTEDIEDIEAKLIEYKEGRNNFLLYQTGVYITAYARRDLVKCIKKICDYADDTMNDKPFDDIVYYDTDSLKMLNGDKYIHIFDEFNKQVKLDMQAAAKYHNLKFELFEPIDNEGNPQLLGKFDREQNYDTFKTLGAKRYCYKIGDNFGITIAGVSKKLGAEYISELSKLTGQTEFDIFDNDLSFPANKSGKITATYFDKGFTEYVIDYQGNICLCEEKSYIHMENTPYHMGISQDYKQLLFEQFGRKFK